MSSFICDKCGTAIIDTSKGYVTECEHYGNVIEKMDALTKSQVDIPYEFRDVLTNWNYEENEIRGKL